MDNKYLKPRTAAQKAWNAEIDRLIRYGKKHKVEVLLPPKPKRVTAKKLSGIRTMRGVRIPTRIRTPQQVRTTPKPIAELKIETKPQTKSQRYKDKTVLNAIAATYASQYGITIRTFLNQYKRYLSEADYRKTGIPYDPVTMQEYLNDLADGTVKKPPKKEKPKEDTQQAQPQPEQPTSEPPEQEVVPETPYEETVSDEIEDEYTSIYDDVIDNFKQSLSNYQNEAPELVNAFNDIIDILEAESDTETIALLLNDITNQIGDIDQFMYYGIGRAFDYMRKFSNLMRIEGYDDLADTLDIEIERYEQVDTINYEISEWKQNIGARSAAHDKYGEVNKVWKGR